MWVLRCICLLLTVHIFKAKNPESGLCKSDTNVTSLSCSHQLWGADSSPDDCIMWLPGNTNRHIPTRNTKECDAMSFRDGSKFSVHPGLVEAKLGVYHYTFDYPGQQTVHKMVFNVTFSNSKWRELRMRFKTLGTQTEAGFSNFCREFSINTDKMVPLISQLFYDCLFDNNMSGKNYTFEYYATDDSSVSFGKYSFKVPDYDFGKKLFMYTDFSQMPLLKLRLQTNYDGFSFKHKEFNVVLHYKKKLGDKVNYTLSPTLRNESEWTYEYDTDFRSGNYYFEVWTSEDNQSSITPQYTIEDNPNQEILVITIVGCGGALLALFAFIFFIWRQREAMLKDSKQPRVLMIYSPTTVNHISVVIQLANYLKEFCHVNALAYHIEVPKTQSKDPFKWFNDAFKDSNFLMVLSSPCNHCNKYKGIYMNIDTLGLRLLAEDMGNLSSKRMFGVVLPYCTEMNMPPEAKNLPNFNLPKDFRKMLGFIHTRSTSLYTQYIVEPFVYGGKSNFGPEGSHLLRAMEEARFELGKHDCVCKQNSHPIELDQLDEHTFCDVELGDSYSEEKMLPDSEKQQLPEEMIPCINELNLQGTEDDHISDSINTIMPDPFVDLNSLLN